MRQQILLLIGFFIGTTFRRGRDTSILSLVGRLLNSALEKQAQLKIFEESDRRLR